MDPRGMNNTSWIHVFMGDFHDFTSFTSLDWLIWSVWSSFETGAIQTMRLGGDVAADIKEFRCGLVANCQGVARSSWQKMTKQFPKKIGYSRLVGGRMICPQIPFRELTYPTFWKGKYLQKIPFVGSEEGGRMISQQMDKESSFDCSNMHKSRGAKKLGVINFPSPRVFQITG